MRLVEDRGLVEIVRPGSGIGIPHYLYRAIAWIDYQRHAFKQEINLSFFDQEKLPIHKAGELMHPILVCFKNGQFQVLPATHNSNYARVYLGIRYTQVSAWAFLPYPDSIHNPGTNSQKDIFFQDSDAVYESPNNSGEKVHLDFYYIWHKSLKGATSFVSNLASLWKSGLDTISSLTSDQQKSLINSAKNSENSN